jgi:hypothetical protein
MNGGFEKGKLEEIGFQEIALWDLDGGRLIYKPLRQGTDVEALFEFPNALYAFTIGERVHYIGKTTKSIRQRFVSYCNPGNSKRTNRKVHDNILKELAKPGSSVAILIFTGIHLLRYGIFEINLPAGLEDGLIKAFNPKWNGRYAGESITETEEIENETVIPRAEQDLASLPIKTLRRFQVKLGKTYFTMGFINTGKAASDAIGADGGPMLIRLGSMQHPGVPSKIDRRANLNGTPRIYGGARVAHWFHEHFKVGSVVEAQVVTPNEILLHSGKS